MASMLKKHPEQKLEELQELSPALQEITIDKPGKWLYRYYEKSELGKVIYEDFINYNRKKLSEVIPGRSEELDTLSMRSKRRQAMEYDEKKNVTYVHHDNEFFFSDDMLDVGVLSQAQGFQVLAMLLENFDLDESAKQAKKEWKKGDGEKEPFLVKMPPLSKIDTLLDDLFDRTPLIPGTTDKYQFDCSPYLPGHVMWKTGEYAYEDSMTWFVSAMLSMFRLYIHGKYVPTPTRMQKAVDRVKFCMDYLNNAFIGKEHISARLQDAYGWSWTGSEDVAIKANESLKLPYGWNWTDGCEEPSLYFNFAMSEVFIDLHSTFETIIDLADIEYIRKNIDLALAGKATAEEIETKKEQLKIKFQESLEKDASDDEEMQGELARMREVFAAINGVSEVYGAGSRYAIFESEVQLTAEKIWDAVREKFATEFYATTLESTLTETVIEQSITNDALFNTVFVINTLINAGMDEVYDDQINYYTVNGSKEFMDAINNFDEIRDAMRLGYDKAYQFYRKLSKKGKEYKVSEFSLSFDEHFEKHNEVVKELRKAHLRIFSLMPLLVKTKTTMSEFVIKYPQYDMQMYLEHILDYRCERTVKNTDGTTDTKAYWTWEKEGYSSSSNYYFASALNDFYNYYAEYEEILLDAEYKKNAIIEEVKTKTTRELQDTVIKDLKQQVEALKGENATLEEGLTAAREKLANDPVRKALTGFVNELLQETIKGVVGKMLGDLAVDIRASAKDSKNPAADGKVSEQSEETAIFQEGFRAFGLSMVRECIYDAIKSAWTEQGKELEESRVEKRADKMEEAFAEDLKSAITSYVAPMVMGQPSAFVTTKGGEPSEIAKKLGVGAKKD